MSVEPLFVSGPSGVGKSFLTRYLVEHYYCQKIITTTTRTPRSGESHGINYYFISQEQYEHLERTVQLCISDRLFGACYGIEKDEIERIRASGKTPICEVYSPHISLFVEAFPKSRAIFLQPRNYDFLVHRMQLRGDSEDQIADRLQAAYKELENYPGAIQQYYCKTYLIDMHNFYEIVDDIHQRFL